MTKAEDQINEWVKDNKVFIASKSYCPFCKRAKALFDSLNQEYLAVELDERDDGPDLQQTLAKLNGTRTVPNIYVSGTHIGGSDDLVSAKESGKLQKLLA